MGEQITPTIFLNGKPFEIGDCKIDTDMLKPNDEMVAHICPEKSLTVTMKLSFSKISRKRLIQAIEKQGFSRKYAKQLAWNFNKRKIPYGKALTLMFLWKAGDTNFISI